jgi:hypothetical protein
LTRLDLLIIAAESDLDEGIVARFGKAVLKQLENGADPAEEIGDSLEIDGFRVQVDTHGTVAQVTITHGPSDGHKLWLELWRDGAPFASTLSDPRLLINDPHWPTGDYQMYGLCSCPPADQKRHVGTLCTYGDGIGIVRLQSGRPLAEMCPIDDEA